MYAVTTANLPHDDIMRGKVTVQVAPTMSAIDGFENVRPCGVLPWEFTELMQPAVRPVIRPELRFGWKIVKTLDTLHNVTVVATTTT